MVTGTLTRPAFQWLLSYWSKKIKKISKFENKMGSQICWLFIFVWLKYARTKKPHIFTDLNFKHIIRQTVFVSYEIVLVDHIMLIPTEIWHCCDSDNMSTLKPIHYMTAEFGLKLRLRYFTSLKCLKLLGYFSGNLFSFAFFGFVF